MKNKNKYLPLIMAITNSACMSLVMCLINVGLIPPFFIEFIKSFFIGLIVTLPISYFLPALLNRRKDKYEINSIIFKEMRRNKQLLPENETIQIFEKNTSGTLALLGGNAYPYAVPISYVYLDGKIYFHAANEGHKIDAIKANNKASFCIIDADNVVPEEYTTYYRSAIAFGKIKIVQDDNVKRMAIKKFTEKYVSLHQDATEIIEKTYDNFCIIELDIEHMTGKESMRLVQQRK